LILEEGKAGILEGGLVVLETKGDVIQQMLSGRRGILIGNQKQLLEKLYE
jgi:hypothetical protein